MGWNQAKEAAEKVKSGLFINLANDGDKVVLCFPYTGEENYSPTGDKCEPHVVEMFWDDKLEKNVPFTAEHRAAGKEPNPKYKFNVHEKGDDADKLKIFECTTATFKNILESQAKYGPQHAAGLAALYFEIKRHGAPKSKKTKYSVMYDGPVPEELIGKLKAIAPKDRHDLTKSGDDDDDDKKKGKSNGASQGSATIDDATFKEFQPMLKALSEDNRRAFLKEYGISRARELKLSDVDKARKWLKEHQPAPAGATDDFAE